MKKNITKMILSSLGIVTILSVGCAANALATTKFDNIFEKFFGSTTSKLKGDTLGADTQYYKSDYSSPKDLYTYEEKKVAEIVQEGITLLENKDLLPLSKGTKLSLFSHSSVDLVSGGSGSGSGSFELTKDLKEGLENAGLEVNEDLWDFYKNGDGSSYKRGVGVVNYGADLDWRINECPLDKITAKSTLVDSFKDTTAMFVLSRTGGEGGDEARDMAAFGGKSGEHYLEPNEEELKIISYLNDNFKDVIILINCNNSIELGWVKNYENIKAVVNFPGAGRTGTYGLGYMLTGKDIEGKEISSSGHLVDTWVYDNFSSPAMQNMGDFRFKDTDYYYVNYSEGIYVGYKYYETRYEDYVNGRTNVGNYDYDNTVIYPFGYGLSYTNFSWSNYTMSSPDINGDLNISITVKNIGKRAGKDVVQIYGQSPYIGGVEKSSVNLVGLAKTKNLAPNEEETLNIKVNLKELTSYDVSSNNGNGGYILDEGNYYITAAGNAHEAINQILNKKAQSESSFIIDSSKLVDSKEDSNDFAASEESVHVYNHKQYDSTSYLKATEDGEIITNQFANADLEDGKYLSRNNWTIMENNNLRYGTVSEANSKAEINGKQFQTEVSETMLDELKSFKSLNPNEGNEIVEVNFGKKNNIDLIDLRGLDYNDPMWDDLLDEITMKELSKLIDEAGYCTPEVKSINKPKVTDLDGPAGLNDIVAHGSMPIGDNYRAMTWPTQYMLACTWNVKLAEEMGRGIAEDGLYSQVAGWYGPGMNIHRTPFAGRNFEYYSEDAFLSGLFGKYEVNGAAQKGMYAFIKHFALNDQETHRDERGIATFAQEQAIREIYLKPFEMTIIDNNVEIDYNEPVKNERGKITSYIKKTREVPAATAVMTSFNRIGTTWAGGHYNLITEVLREEWKFNGFVLTDYEVGRGKGSYMDTLQCLAAGGDAKLKTVGMDALFGFDISKYPAYQGYGREAAHHILYCVVNSQGMNGFVHGVRFVRGFPYYYLLVGAYDILSLAGIAFCGVVLARNIKKIVKNKKKSS